MFSASVEISVGSSPHLARLDEARQNLLGDANLVREDAAELHLDHMIAGDEIVDVAIDEPVLPDRLEHEVQKEPNVLGVRRPLLGRGQRRLDLVPELGEQIGDDLLPSNGNGSRGCRG